MSRYFEGWYHKLQRDGKTLALIPGFAEDGTFVQVLTDEESYYIPYSSGTVADDNRVTIGRNHFSPEGCELHIDSPELSLHGEVHYENLTPLRSDIMGFFRFFPMQCRHGVISMHHRLEGQLYLNDKTYDFNQGTGYIEKDSGRSFPQHYTWIQCNDFEEKCSIMAAVAHIPFGLFSFPGCICVVHHGNKEYRLATYNGVKIRFCEEGKIHLSQGPYRLVIDVPSYKANHLYAPNLGSMGRSVHECASCRARFRFYHGNTPLFDKYSDHASYEYVPKPMVAPKHP